MDAERTAQEMSDGIRIAYNFTRPHVALNGKMPAEAAGVDLKLEQNRWKSLIQ